MNLIIKDILSEKVKVVQAVFDVDDFQHSSNTVLKESEDTTMQVKLVDGSGKCYDRKVDSDDVFIDENGIYHYVTPHCSHCHSGNVTKHDTNLTPVYSKDGTKEYVKVKKYRCNNCGKNSQVEFKDEFKKYSGLPVKLEEIIEKINSLHWISLRDIIKIIKFTKGIDISQEFVRKAELTTEDFYWCDEDFKSAKIVNYDCQWIPTDEGWMYLHMLVDFNSKKIFAIELTENEEKETIREFFKKTMKIYPDVMITDGKWGYHELIKDEMGIDHQECIIHFRKSLNRKIKKELNKIKSKIHGLILNKTPDINQTDLINQIEDYMEPIYDEYWSYKDAVMKSFEFESYEESSQYIQNLRSTVKTWPEAICKYVTDQFLNIHRRLILYKDEKYKDKIPSNNNLSETKIGWCASKYEKRRYRTGLGFFNHILSRIIHWG